MCGDGYITRMQMKQLITAVHDYSNLCSILCKIVLKALHPKAVYVIEGNFDDNRDE
jgi:hypothetical protein